VAHVRTHGASGSTFNFWMIDDMPNTFPNLDGSAQGHAGPRKLEEVLEEPQAFCALLRHTCSWPPLPLDCRPLAPDPDAVTEQPDFGAVYIDEDGSTSVCGQQVARQFHNVLINAAASIHTAVLLRPERGKGPESARRVFVIGPVKYRVRRLIKRG